MNESDHEERISTLETSMVELQRALVGLAKTSTQSDVVMIENFVVVPLLDDIEQARKMAASPGVEAGLRQSLLHKITLLETRLDQAQAALLHLKSIVARIDPPKNSP